MKYAFSGRDTGNISICCEKRKNQVFLVIRYDGTGLP